MKFLALSAVLLVVVLCSSCRDPLTYTTRSQLLASSGTILVITVDSTKYYLEEYRTGPDSLLGRGTMLAREARVAFSGGIAYNQITHIIGSGRLGAQEILYAGLVLLLSVQSVPRDVPIFQAEDYTPSSYGGSCPIVVSHDGLNSHIEGEAFGTALGKGLLTETGVVLRHARMVDGAFEFSILNDRPETHFIDKVGAVAVETPKGATVVLDPQQRPWWSHHSIEPSSATDQSGREVREALSTDDGIAWSSPGAAYCRPGSSDDELIVEFPAPTVRGRLSGISIRAINTPLAAFALEHLYGLLGGEAQDFISAADQDQELIALLREWLDRASMHIFLETPDGWRLLGAIRPEASAAWFEKLLTFEWPPARSSTIRLKLTSIAEGWDLDAIRLHPDIHGPLKTLDLTPRLIEAPARVRRTHTLGAADDRFEILLPGDGLKYRVHVPRSLGDEHLSFVIYARGYLCEWPRDPRAIISASLRQQAPSSRLNAVKSLMREPQRLLPPMYMAWDLYKRVAAR